MKRWTVMVIPQGQGSTQTLHVSSLHTWALYGVGGIVAVLCFTTAFFAQRYFAKASEVEALRASAPIVVTAPAPESEDATPVDNVALAADERAAVEKQLREEYDQRNESILRELSELYTIEQDVRTIHGLPPRDTAHTNPIGAKGSGKGGGPSMIDPDDTPFEDLVLPPSLIYGMSNPSADLLAQEIAIRKESLIHLLDKMAGKRDRVERTPSIWPSNHNTRRITSTFGTRRDPITAAFRHHDGTDISAIAGTPVVATAKGKDIEADYHRFFGNLVKIDHGGGLETWYAHMQRFTVKEGDRVERGQQVGTVGATGRATGAHIHYEVHLNGRPVDSGKYLGNY